MNHKKVATRVVGIDYGMVRIGIAISDETHLIALPKKTLLAEKKSELTAKKILVEIDHYMKEYNCTIDTIVIGFPLMMSGKKGSLADDVSHLISLLNEKSTIPIVTWDERLTSVQAERSLRESGMTRKSRTKHVDAVAAVIILQNYLDSRHIQKNQ